MKLKNFILFVLLLTFAFSSVPYYAQDTDNTVNPVTYENELYYIKDNIPASKYVLISKDITKPAYYGIYTNYKGTKAVFQKQKKLLYGTAEDYIFPHYFENTDIYSMSDTLVPSNQGNCLLSEYFEYNTILDISNYKTMGARNDFLYLENCYAVDLNDFDKVDIDLGQNGFFPVKKLFDKEKKYSIKLSQNKFKGYYVFCKYDKDKNTIITSSLHTFNIKNHYQTAVELLLDDDYEYIFKMNVDIVDRSGNIVCASTNINKTGTNTRKYEISDVSSSLINYVSDAFDDINHANLSNEEIKKNFSDIYCPTKPYAPLYRKKKFNEFPSLIHSEADAEYVKYIRQIYAICIMDSSGQQMVSKYLRNAVSFDDLETLLSYFVYDIYVKINFNEYKRYPFKILPDTEIMYQ